MTSHTTANITTILWPCCWPLHSAALYTVYIYNHTHLSLSFSRPLFLVVHHTPFHLLTVSSPSTSPLTQYTTVSLIL